MVDSKLGGAARVLRRHPAARDSWTVRTLMARAEDLRTAAGATQVSFKRNDPASASAPAQKGGGGGNSSESPRSTGRTSSRKGKLRFERVLYPLLPRSRVIEAGFWGPARGSRGGRKEGRGERGGGKGRGKTSVPPINGGFGAPPGCEFRLNPLALRLSNPRPRSNRPWWAGQGHNHVSKNGRGLWRRVHRQRAASSTPHRLSDIGGRTLSAGSQWKYISFLNNKLFCVFVMGCFVCFVVERRLAINIGLPALKTGVHRLSLESAGFEAECQCRPLSL